MLKQWNEYRIIKKSGLFDSAYYLLNYPDVRKADIDPLMHFIRYGWKEGRDPSKYFNVGFYLYHSPDVAQSSINPVFHYLNDGMREGRQINTGIFGKDIAPHLNKNNKRIFLRLIGEINMRNLKKVFNYWRLHGFNSLIKKIKLALTDERIQRQVEKIIPSEKAQEAIVRILSVSDQNTYEKIFQDHFPSLRPINCYYSPHKKLRLNLVTDSINSGSLFGGVATSLILCTLIAEKYRCELRIITRTEPPNKQNFYNIIKINNLPEPQNVDFIFLDSINDNSELPVGDDEYFLTTSWWTTHSVLESFSGDRIFYLIQEDERSFYPYGDERYLCTKILCNKHIKFIVNSQLLYEHFLSEGFSNFKDQGDWFEPSFTKGIFYYDQSNFVEKKNFLFYARPNNPRNLYYLGIRVINQALEIGLFDPEKWNINFVGKDLNKIKLANTIIPNIYQNLSLDEYAKLVRKIDLGLCLMYTPHPSYPPLDLAASGSIVVTNKFANKQNLDNYSKNIICCDLGDESLIDGIKKGLILSSDIDKRQQNYNNNNLLTDWQLSFNTISSRMNLQ